MAQWLRGCYSCRGPGWVRSPAPMSGSQASVAQVQFQGSWHLSSDHQRHQAHARCPDTHTSKIHKNIFNYYFKSYLSTRVEAVYKNKRKA